VQNFLKIGSGVPELEDPEKWHFPLKPFITLTTVIVCCQAVWSAIPATAWLLVGLGVKTHKNKPTTRLVINFL